MVVGAPPPALLSLTSGDGSPRIRDGYDACTPARWMTPRARSRLTSTFRCRAPSGSSRPRSRSFGGEHPGQRHALLCSPRRRTQPLATVGVSVSRTTARSFSHPRSRILSRASTLASRRERRWLCRQQWWCRTGGAAGVVLEDGRGVIVRRCAQVPRRHHPVPSRSRIGAVGRLWDPQSCGTSWSCRSLKTSRKNSPRSITKCVVSASWARVVVATGTAVCGGKVACSR